MINVRYFLSFSLFQQLYDLLNLVKDSKIIFDWPYNVSLGKYSKHQDFSRIIYEKKKKN